MLDTLASWIKTTTLHDFSIASYWFFPAAETLHFMGLTVLFGMLLLIDLRGLGFYKTIAIEQVHKLVPIVLVAFAVNLLTGLIFIFTDPDRYFVNIAFQVKMYLIVVAGLNALAFEFIVFRPSLKGRMDMDRSVLTKIISALSLLLWTSVIIAGRFIPYVEV